MLHRIVGRAPLPVISRRLSSTSATTKNWRLMTDGAARGNPGLAGAGAILWDPAGRTFERISFLGVCTNNEAEYKALLLGLDLAAECGADSLTCYIDSNLIVSQVNGQFSVRAKNLKLLHRQVGDALTKFPSWQLHHVGREHNSLADALANRAIDERMHSTEISS